MVRTSARVVSPATTGRSAGRALGAAGSGSRASRPPWRTSSREWLLADGTSPGWRWDVASTRLRTRRPRRAWRVRRGWLSWALLRPASRCNGTPAPPPPKGCDCSAPFACPSSLSSSSSSFPPLLL